MGSICVAHRSRGHVPSCSAGAPSRATLFSACLLPSAVPALKRFLAIRADPLNKDDGKWECKNVSTLPSPIGHSPSARCFSAAWIVPDETSIHHPRRAGGSFTCRRAASPTEQLVDDRLDERLMHMRRV